MSNLLRAENLSCIRQQKKLFANLSFQLHAGELLLIEGENGVGKSSLLRLLTGLATPAEGDVYWREQSIQYLGKEYHHQMHYLGHSNGIKLGLTVLENLRFATMLTTQACKHSETILTALQLQDHRHTQAKYLSAGQKRRLGLARLFMCPKLIWILDEPLTALDINTQDYFLMQLEKHLQQGGFAIVSSHHIIHLPNVRVATLRLNAC